MLQKNLSIIEKLAACNTNTDGGLVQGKNTVTSTSSHSQQKT